MGFTFYHCCLYFFTIFFFTKRHTSKQFVWRKEQEEGWQERKIREGKKWELNKMLTRMLHGDLPVFSPNSSSARTAPTGAGLSGPSESTPVLGRASRSGSPSQAKRGLSSSGPDPRTATGLPIHHKN